MAGNGLLRFKGCVSIPKDHTIREEVGKFREPTTTTPKEYILITSAPWMDSSQILLAWYDERHQRLCQDLRHMLTSGDSLYGMLELRTAARAQGTFLETTTSDFITDLLPSRRRNQVDDVILMQIRHLYSLPEGYRRPCAGELLFGRVASIFDMLKNMISVRGSIFTSKLWSSLCYYNSPGVKCRLSTAFR